ncbi:MAG: transposase [Acidobacteriota bacterium]
MPAPSPAARTPEILERTGATAAPRSRHPSRFGQLLTHKGKGVQGWLKRKKSHSRFHFHFIPTSSSWLNLVERCFGAITRRRIRWGCVPKR